MEGNQVVLILLKLLSAISEKLSRLLTTIGMAYLKHRQKKKELGLKKGKVIKSDKLELLIAKSLKKKLIERERKLGEEVRVSKFKLDSYKLEMQSELAELEKNIRSLELAVEKATDVDQSMLQKELQKSIKEKADFTQEVNKNLLKITEKNSSLEKEYKHLLDNLKICSKSIDGFASNRSNDMTESMRSDFETLVKEESLVYADSLNPKEKSYIKEAEKLIDDAQKNKTLLGTQEKDFVVNYAYKTKDMDKTKDVLDFLALEGFELANGYMKPEIKYNPEKIDELMSKSKEKDKEFEEEYFEKLRRKSLAKEKNKDLAISR